MKCAACGSALPDSSKFCPACGAKVVSGRTLNEGSHTRQEIWEGSVRKCPQCGAVLESFAAYCPACGYELRDVGISDAVRAFSSEYADASTTKKRIALIKSYPVPNAREDLLEFMILAKSGIEDATDAKERAAWIAKGRQCIEKGRMLLKDHDLAQLESMGDEINKALARWLALKALAPAIGIILAIVSACIDISGGNASFLEIIALIVVFYSSCALSASGDMVLSVIACAACALCLGVGSAMDALGGNGSVIILFSGLALIISLVLLVRNSVRGFREKE